jgi:hypothetical protein
LNAIALAPELAIGRFDLNDSIFHYTMSERMVQAFERGENPLDCWVSEWTLGYPVSRTYQPLGHLTVAVVYIGLGKLVSLMTVFGWIRYLAVALLPFTIYIAGRQFHMNPSSAAAAALISPLISTNGLYGIEYGSYIWRGQGLFTQSLAMHLLLLSAGLTFRAMRGEGKGVLSGALLGLTFLTHFIYGYIGAIITCLIAALSGPPGSLKRFTRLAIIAFTAFSVSAFVLLPALSDSSFVNHSRWEPDWKWDSFGAIEVTRLLIRGQLMDFGRLPVLSVIVLLGAVVCVWQSRGTGSEADGYAPKATYRTLLWTGILCLVLFFGRPTWGGFYTLFGTQDIQLHRLLGAVHLFFILLGGIGLATIWEALRSRKVPGASVLIVAGTILIVLPALTERYRFLSEGRQWGGSNSQAVNAEQASVSQVADRLRNVSGRVYAGLGAGWGKDFRVGYVPLYGFLSVHHIPAVSFLYHAMALTSDIMVLFDENDPDHYRLFNVSSVLSDGRALPSFLYPAEQIDRFHIAEAEAGGYFEVVRVQYAVNTNRDTFYETTAAWLRSGLLRARTHLLLDFNGDVPADVKSLQNGAPIPLTSETRSAGAVQSEARNGERYDAIVRIDEPSYVLFKMTYHRNWKATVDGQPRRTFMLTPGFVGVAVEPGAHRIVMTYSSGPLQYLLLAGGIVSLAGIAVATRRLL